MYQTVGIVLKKHLVQSARTKQCFLKCCARKIVKIEFQVNGIVFLLYSFTNNIALLLEKASQNSLSDFPLNDRLKSAFELEFRTK